MRSAPESSSDSDRAKQRVAIDRGGVTAARIRPGCCLRAGGESAHATPGKPASNKLSAARLACTTVPARSTTSTPAAVPHQRRQAFAELADLGLQRGVAVESSLGGAAEEREGLGELAASSTGGGGMLPLDRRRRLQPAWKVRIRFHGMHSKMHRPPW